jgi:hypothetical protein
VLQSGEELPGCPGIRADALVKWSDKFSAAVFVQHPRHFLLTAPGADPVPTVHTQLRNHILKRRGLHSVAVARNMLPPDAQSRSSAEGHKAKAARGRAKLAAALREAGAPLAA